VVEQMLKRFKEHPKGKGRPVRRRPLLVPAAGGRSSPRAIRSPRRTRGPGVGPNERRGFSGLTAVWIAEVILVGSWFRAARAGVQRPVLTGRKNSPGPGRRESMTVSYSALARATRCSQNLSARR
jgi:hypothetical protein